MGRYAKTMNYLQKIDRLNQAINNKLSEIQQYRDMAFSISAVELKERVQTSPDFDKMSNIIAKLEKMEAELDKTVDYYVDCKNRIVKQIEGIDDTVLYDVLFARYVEKKTFEKIAVDIDYSFRQVLRLHEKALGAFEKKYGTEY